MNYKLINPEYLGWFKQKYGNYCKAKQMYEDDPIINAQMNLACNKIKQQIEKKLNVSLEEIIQTSG